MRICTLKKSQENHILVLTQLKRCVLTSQGNAALGLGTVFDCLFQMSEETDTFRCLHLLTRCACMCAFLQVYACLPAFLCDCVCESSGVYWQLQLWGGYFVHTLPPPGVIWFTLLPAGLQLVLMPSSTYFHKSTQGVWMGNVTLVCRCSMTLLPRSSNLGFSLTGPRATPRFA